ncbi:RluA family pseudouridine synthase [Microlunatus elymi]|uniref:RluA family pseudouridine synthase n=1 Tax=Microlunatus elymi TaxID=2596828 RepID=UPI001AEF655A|nr:RluA family pseudouridine synthase [Microlunatus elymi]
MASTWQQVRDQHVLYEDDLVLVIDKPGGIGLVGERHDTDLMQQARDAGEFVMPAHRIDKVTSGLVLLARDQQTHAMLTRQFADRTVIKEYLAVVREPGLGDHGRIDLPLSVGRKSRVRVAANRDDITEIEPGHWTVPAGRVFDHVRSYPASTDFRTVAETEDHAALALRPHTGRRHQLRVQLAWIGHPIEGDPLFCKPTGPRTHLHSWRLTFAHPTQGELTVTADPVEAFWQPLGGPVPELTGNP